MKRRLSFKHPLGAEHNESLPHSHIALTLLRRNDEDAFVIVRPYAQLGQLRRRKRPKAPPALPTYRCWAAFWVLRHRLRARVAGDDPCLASSIASIFSDRQRVIAPSRAQRRRVSPRHACSSERGARGCCRCCLAGCLAAAADFALPLSPAAAAGGGGATAEAATGVPHVAMAKSTMTAVAYLATNI